MVLFILYQVVRNIEMKIFKLGNNSRLAVFIAFPESLHHSSSLLVFLPIADTTTSNFSSWNSRMIFATFLTPSAFFTEAPPNLKTFILFITFAKVITLDMKKNSITTLNQFISDQQNQFPFVQGSLSRIFRDIQLAAKMINR